jgi:hypothetical protein
MLDRDDFPVVLDLDPARKRLNVMKYGSVLAAVNVGAVAIVLALFGVELPVVGRPLGAAHVTFGLHKLLVLLILFDAAWSRKLWVSLFSRVIVHWDRLEVLAALRRRVVYFVEVERVEAVDHKGARLCVFSLAGGRKLPIVNPAARWPVLEQVLPATALGELLAQRDRELQAKLTVEALPIVLARDWGSIAVQVFVVAPIMLFFGYLGVLLIVEGHPHFQAGLGVEGGWVASGILAAGLAAATLGGIKGWLRTSFTEVVVDHDRLEIGFRRKQTTLFADIVAVDLVKQGSVRRLRLELADGTKSVIEPAIASFPQLYPFVRYTLLARLAEEVEASLRGSGGITLREPSWSSWLETGSSRASKSKQPDDKLPSDKQTAQLLDRQAWALRRGFSLTSAGLMPIDDEFATPSPWRDLECAQADLAGIEFRTAAGEKFSASAYAENYLPVMTWLHERGQA